DLAETLLHELRECVEVVRAILLAREEPTVARGPAIAIAELAELGIPIDPRVDACATDHVRCAAVQRLGVVAEREQYVSRLIRLWRARTAHEVACVIGQPLVEVLFA